MSVGSCWAHSQKCDRRMLASSCLAACLSPFPSARPHRKLCFHWTDLYEIWCLRLLKNKVPLKSEKINPLNPELNPVCYLLALLGAHHFLHVSRIRVKSLTLGLLMSYIYGAPILDVSRSHTTTQHSR